MNRNFLGKGITFPVGVNLRGNVSLSEYEGDIAETILLILGTAFGERQMRPDFGCGIHDLVFHPNNANTHALIIHHILEALTRWEPRILGVQVKVEAPPEEPNTVYVHLSYKVRSTNNVFNLVYPFYLQSEAT